MDSAISLKFDQFGLKDKKIIQSFIDTYQPWSCEYNFANLFTWQKKSKLSWTIYENRLLVYDGIEKSSFMPIGKVLTPEELALLSKYLKKSGFMPDFRLATSEYLNKFPDIEEYYTVKEDRDNAEYIYDVNKLSELTGRKLHKKRNLISQFKRNCPGFKTGQQTKAYKQKALLLARHFMNRSDKSSNTLEQEYSALKAAFACFDELDMGGVVISIGDTLAAFSIFSRLNNETYDIQFEKADIHLKGASQAINRETAKYLKDRCRYLNREQDLGIAGLRQAKISYEPVKIITPYALIFKGGDF